MFGLVDSEVVDGTTYIFVGCTGGSGNGVGDVQRCKASTTCSKSLRVVSPDSKLGFIYAGGLVSSEMILMADWWSTFFELTAGKLKCLG